MSATVFSIVIIIEVILTAFIAWGIMHEEKFIAFEDKIIFAILRKIRARRKAQKNGR